MKKYKFIGTEGQASGYDDPKPKVGEVYDWTRLIGDRTVGYWATASLFTSEWTEVTEEEITKKPTFPTHNFPLGSHVVEPITRVKRLVFPTSKQLSQALRYIYGGDVVGEDFLEDVMALINLYLSKGTPTLDDLDQLKQ